MSEKNNSPAISTRRNSLFPADVLEVAYAIGDNQHRKRLKNSVGNLDTFESAPDMINSTQLINHFTIRYEDQDPVPEYFQQVFNSEDGFDDQICSLLESNSKILYESRILCSLCDSNLELPFCADDSTKLKTYEEQQPDTRELFEELIFPNSTPKSEIDLKKISPFVLPKYKQWKNLQKSYRIIPNAERLDNKLNFMDFIGNTSYKCIMISSQSGHGKAPGRVVPSSIPESTLYISQEIDLISIDDVKCHRTEINPAKDKHRTINAVAKERMRISRKMKTMMDVRELVYYPFYTFNGPLNTEIQPFPNDSLRLLFSVIHAIELNIDELDTRYIPISYSLGHFIPFLKAALAHPEMEYHIICSSAHIGFFFELSNALNSISNYLHMIDFIPLRAAFYLSDKFNTRKILIYNTEIARFANSVETGAFLSILIRCLQCASSLHSLPINLSVYQSAIDFISGRKSRPSIAGLEQLRLYKVRFCREEDQRVHISVFPLSHHSHDQTVVPSYWPLFNKLRNPYTFSPRPTVFNNSLSFTVRNVKDPDIESPLSFTPGSSSFMFVI